ncbi:MAG: hypothetical protein ACHQLQ_10465 [Candidatus Acidiferrales bacterium]
MKKAVIFAALSLFTLLIVLPIKSFVYQTLGNPALHNLTLRADGNPYPPLPPKKPSLSPATLVADGNPYPPLPPKKLSVSSDSLIADGNPYPPLPPKKPRSVFGSPDPGVLASATLLGTNA